MITAVEKHARFSQSFLYFRTNLQGGIAPSGGNYLFTTEAP